MYEKTTFTGRFKAHAPYYEAQSLDSRGGRPLNDYAQFIRDNFPALTDSSTIDVSGFPVSGDDETNDYSGDGASNVID